MFGPIVSAGIGALIGAIWDDGDDGMGSPTKQNQSVPVEDIGRIISASLSMQSVVGYSQDPERFEIAKNIAKEYKEDTIGMAQEAQRVARVLYSPSYDASAAEVNDVTSKYRFYSDVDDQAAMEKDVRIYDSIDPTDDADAETGDAYSFETEIENLFGPEQMAISEEDIAPDTDVQDWDITEPTDEISQEREVTVGDDTITPEDEISVVEEAIPFEEVFYPDETDLDMDPTDDFDEVLYPREQYDLSDTTDDLIQWPEQELDDFADELDANVFESAAWTFDQDISQEALTGDETYQDVGQELNVIDFENFLDDVSAIPLDLTSDHLGVPFFQWLDQPPGGESLDIDPV